MQASKVQFGGNVSAYGGVQSKQPPNSAQVVKFQGNQSTGQGTTPAKRANGANLGILAVAGMAAAACCAVPLLIGGFIAFKVIRGIMGVVGKAKSIIGK